MPKIKLLNQDKVKAILDTAHSAKKPTLTNQEASQLISEIGIPVPSSKTITSATEAVKFSQENSFPLVLKLSAPGLLHKSDVGGVVTNLNSELELNTAYEKITDTLATLSKDSPQKIEIQIQKQISSGIEVILGIKRDPSFGPVLLFGAGGKLAEILDDYNLITFPISLEKAQKIVSQSKIYKLLSGYRDDPAYDLSKLFEIMIKLGQLISDYPEIHEIEINPLIITHQDTWAVDPKVLLK